MKNKIAAVLLASLLLAGARLRAQCLRNDVNPQCWPVTNLADQVERHPGYEKSRAFKSLDPELQREALAQVDADRSTGTALAPVKTSAGVFQVLRHGIVEVASWLVLSLYALGFALRRLRRGRKHTEVVYDVETLGSGSYGERKEIEEKNYENDTR